MIINNNRKPELSLYYIGGVIIEILKDNDEMNIELLYQKVKNNLSEDCYINFYYFALDWLYLSSVIILNERNVYLCE